MRGVLEWKDQVGIGKEEREERGLRGETAKIKGLLRGSMETSYSRSFLKYIHV